MQVCSIHYSYISHRISIWKDGLCMHLLISDNVYSNYFSHLQSLYSEPRVTLKVEQCKKEVSVVRSMQMSSTEVGKQKLTDAEVHYIYHSLIGSYDTSLWLVRSS